MSGRWVGVIAIGLTVSGFASSARAQSGSWAESLFSERGVDFGPVPRGAKVRHNFVLRNRLNEPVTVLDVRASCGCTTGRASASTIPAGGQAVIEAEMDTRNFVGPKATTLTVTLLTASGRQADARFGVQSNILADVVLNPGSVDFGVVSKGQGPTTTVTIERVGFPDWRFTKVIASPAFCKVVQADLVEAYRNGSGVGYNLIIKLRPEAPSGAIRDEIRLLTNDPQSPSVPVLVTGQIQGALTAAPAHLALGSTSSAGTVQGRYLVRGTKPFSIRGIEGNGEGFRLAAGDAGAKTLHILTLEFKPEESATRGDLKRAFRVITDLPDEAPLQLSASLHVAP